jgi:signal transduction histidine kinase
MSDIVREESAPQQATVAVTSMHKSLRRLMAIAIPLTFIELVFNAVQQWGYLDPAFSLAALTLLVVAQIGILVNSWFGSAGRGWFGFYALVNLVVVYLWLTPGLATLSFPANTQPWIWWSVGMAVLAASIYSSPLYSLGYMLILTTGFVLVRLSASGGLVSPARVAEDAAYIILLGATLGSLYYLVLHAARKADIANTLAVQQLTKRTRIDAFERERQLVDALVHDRVLNSLLVAASAESQAQRQRSRDLAEIAISELRVASGDRALPSTITAQALFRALRKAIGRIDPKIRVEVESSSRLALSQEVAAAITEAMLQAIDNAQRHASPTVVSVKMNASVSHLGIQIVDDGKGFRVKRVPRNRLGISNSILARMRNVGGSAAIDSVPGAGTQVSLRWDK